MLHMKGTTTNKTMRNKTVWILAIALVCCASVFTSCKKDPKPDGDAKKALLIILDGWGIGDQSQSDVIAQTATPYIDYLKANYPHSVLQASGEFVGLPDGHNTAHSVNPVLFIYVTENKDVRVQNGALADVAPSILHIMGLQQPKEMTGKCLIVE